MENNNGQSKASSEQIKFTLVEKTYLIQLINIILEMKQDLKLLKSHIEEREKLLDAFDVRQKFGIGRDLLANYRKAGLGHIQIGRKFFYKSSDIIDFNRRGKTNNIPK